VTLRTALEQGTRILTDASVHAPRLTAEVLLAHALRRDRVYLIAHPDEELTEIGWIHFGRYLHERAGGIPTQYITKRQEFYGRDFRVSPEVLIPRPETEHVVTTGLQWIAPESTVVDVGTGSGAIAITIALEARVRMFATDISGAALRVARANAEKLGAPVQFVQCDLLSSFSAGCMDAVVSNPPYVGIDEFDGLQREVRNHEPHVALFAGEDGNSIYRRLITEAERVLRPGGCIVLEMGYKSLEPVRAMLSEGWSGHHHEPDLAGIPRVLAARWHT
jgi:release factor glutamine methyltransferase